MLMKLIPRFVFLFGQPRIEVDLFVEVAQVHVTALLEPVGSFVLPQFECHECHLKIDFEAKIHPNLKLAIDGVAFEVSACFHQKIHL